MKLYDKEIKIGSIFLDPFNPRFIDQQNSSQEVIAKRILDSKDAKELLNSMKINIKWINKIVVIAKKDFSKAQKSIIDIKQAKYIIIEGNNRLACLKSGKIPGITLEDKIPVLLAEKEENETIEEFESQLRITQGIANVMVVKEWSVISKARHLYHMYRDMRKIQNFKNSTPHEIYKRIAEELGIGSAEVRQSIVRFEFYSKINSISDRIPEDHWGYLEAFDRNKEIRKKFGMSSTTNLIELNEENGDESFYEEILKEIPAAIKKAAKEGINTKQFRDIIDKEISNIQSSDSLLEFMQEITNTEGDFQFQNVLNPDDLVTEEEKWNKRFEDIKKQLETFPNIAEWASKYKPNLKSLKVLITRHIKIIDNG